MAEMRLRMEENLHHALANNELQLYYQPYILPHNEKLVGIEALLRWDHPKQGRSARKHFRRRRKRQDDVVAISAWTSVRLHEDMALWNSHQLAPLQIAIKPLGLSAR